MRCSKNNPKREVHISIGLSQKKKKKRKKKKKKEFKALKHLPNYLEGDPSTSLGELLRFSHLLSHAFSWLLFPWTVTMCVWGAVTQF